MLLVRTTVGKSKVSGLGLFAAEFIRAHTVVWRKHPHSRHAYAENEFRGLPARMQDMILFYGYMDIESGRYEIDLDNARFANHAEFPNVFNSRNGIEMIARVDIEPGDEITINYRRCDKMASPEMIDRFPYRHFLKELGEAQPSTRESSTVTEG